MEDTAFFVTGWRARGWEPSSGGISPLKSVVEVQLKAVEARTRSTPLLPAEEQFVQPQIYSSGWRGCPAPPVSPRSIRSNRFVVVVVEVQIYPAAVERLPSSAGISPLKFPMAFSHARSLLPSSGEAAQGISPLNRSRSR